MDTEQPFDTIFKQIQCMSRERRRVTGRGFAIREALEWAYRAGLVEGKSIAGASQVCADVVADVVAPVWEAAPVVVVVVDANSAGSRLSREANDDTRFGYWEER